MALSSTNPIPADWPLWSSTEPRMVQPLPGGLTNNSYLLTAGSRRLVLRLNTPDSDSLDINRAAEAEALACAHRADLSAPLVYCDPGHRYLVTEYIQGQAIRLAHPRHLALLARLTADIHSLPVIQASLNYRTKAETYWRRIESEAYFAEDLIHLREQVRDHLDAAEALCETPVLCHNDLVAGNLVLLDEGALRAIDWEYAAMGDPFFDIALIVEEHGLDESQQGQFLEIYLQRPVTTSDRERIHHGRVVYRYLSLLWYAVRCGSRTEADTEWETMLAGSMGALKRLL